MLTPERAAHILCEANKSASQSCEPDSRQCPPIKHLTMTCSGCPSQWEGDTMAGDNIYIRYRYGCLSWGTGKTEGEAIDDSCPYAKQVGDDMDGVMSTEDMLKNLNTSAELIHGTRWYRR